MAHTTFEAGGVPIKAWTIGVPFEEQARRQIEDCSRLSVVRPHVAVMPDVHMGIGATVGSVIPTSRAIIPAAVGVDIGCGMCAVRTSLTASDLPDNLHELYVDVCRTVPHGGAKRNDSVGAWDHVPSSVDTAWKAMSDAYDRIVAKHPKASATKQAHKQLGTLGGGNHFVEVCLDESQRVWVMLHSGSRGAGNRIGTYFTELARDEMTRLDRKLPNRDLAYLTEGTSHFDDYVEALTWAQEYARISRKLMLSRTLDALRSRLKTFVLDGEAVNCHHNYVSRETHFGEDLWITRKGAVSAREGAMAIIPGSMGTRSFIVRGKGDPESFHSCAHGAGRVMSRSEAKRTITLEQHAKDTEGVVCGKDARSLDESPRAYKDVESVMRAQADLVEVVHTLKQILCVKG